MTVERNKSKGGTDTTDYSPERDIPRAVAEIKSLSPTAIVAWIRENRTEKDEIGKRSQVDVTPQSVSMWFKRHPDVYKNLERQLESDLVTPDAITEDLFQKGIFEKVPCVEKWLLVMGAKGAKGSAKSAWTRLLRSICLGRIPRTKEQRFAKAPIELIDGWGMKHPARLTLQDALVFIDQLKSRGRSTHGYRLVLRNFLKSRMVEGWDTISGALEGLGKYAHLYAPPEKIRAIFAWLKPMSAEAHDASYFSFKTAARLTATLEADAKYVDRERRRITVFEKAALHGEKRRTKKLIPDDLWDLIKWRIDRGGQLFRIAGEELGAILRACYAAIIPELNKEIPMPFHFWRHQFAQHGLRATGWNYGLIARLGGWTVETLERNYGKMDEETAFAAGRKFLVNMGSGEYIVPETPKAPEITPALVSPS